MIRHVVVVNLAGRGYMPFAGSPAASFEEQPLGVATAKVSETTVAVCDGLDEAARAAPARVALAARRERRGPTVVALGVYLAEARDEKGRDGIVFIHALELPGGGPVAAAATALLGGLTEERSRRLRAEVMQLATQALDPRRFLTTWTSEVERRFHGAVGPRVAPAPSALGRIEHDVPGAHAVAWATFGLLSTAQEAPWQVSDRAEGDAAFTVMTPGGARTERASALLMEGVARALEGHERTGETLLDDPRTWPDPPGNPGNELGDKPLAAPSTAQGADVHGARGGGPPAGVGAGRPSRASWLVATGGVAFGAVIALVPRLLASPTAPHEARVAAAQPASRPPVASRAEERADAGVAPRVVAPTAPSAAPSVVANAPDASPPAAAPGVPPARTQAPRSTSSSVRSRPPPPDEPPRPE